MAAGSINVLSVAAGIGGLDLGLSLALPETRLVCAVEIEAYAAEVLAERMDDGRLDDAPIWSDLRTFDSQPWRGLVDIVLAGYPCQPFSHAGRRQGTDDPRHLWPQVARVLRECGAPLLFIENVHGHLSLGFDVVCRELQELGYGVEAGLFHAVEAGAPHLRKRLFALAYANSDGLDRERGRWILSRVRKTHGNDADGRGEVVAAPADGGEAVHTFPPPRAWAGGEGWLAERLDCEPAIRRDVAGAGSRLDRLRACGNGVVPQQAALAFRTLANRILASGT